MGRYVDAAVDRTERVMRQRRWRESADAPAFPTRWSLVKVRASAGARARLLSPFSLRPMNFSTPPGALAVSRRAAPGGHRGAIFHYCSGIGAGRAAPPRALETSAAALELASPSGRRWNSKTGQPHRARGWAEGRAPAPPPPGGATSGAAARRTGRRAAAPPGGVGQSGRRQRGRGGGAGRLVAGRELAKAPHALAAASCIAHSSASSVAMLRVAWRGRSWRVGDHFGSLLGRKADSLCGAWRAAKLSCAVREPL